VARILYLCLTDPIVRRQTVMDPSIVIAIIAALGAIILVVPPTMS
jgi:hypothetical protein